MKHKVVLRFPAEAIITYTLEADSTSEFEERLHELVQFGDAEGAVEIHRIDECTGEDAVVAVNEPLVISGL